MEEYIKKALELAKQNNDTELIQKLTEALELAKQKQNIEEDTKLKSQENINQEENTIQEVKQEVIVEEKQEEKKDETKKEEIPIKKQGHGEVSTITVYQNGKVSLETKYLDIPIQGNNIELNSAMRKIGITLGIDDVVNDRSSEDELLGILDELENEEDIEKIENFLEEAAKVGQKGKELEEKYYANTLERKELPYDKEYQEVLREISFAIEEDKENNNKYVDSNKYEETIMTYKRLIKKIEDLIDEAKNKMSRERIANLEMKMMELEGKINTMENKLKAVEELSNYTFD